ncbi:MAG: acyl-CoA dehydrogenase family protein [bacterium]
MASLDEGRVGVSAQACGIATAARDAAAAYARAHPADAEAAVRAGEADAWVRAGFGLCLRAASLKDAGRPFTRPAAMAKLYCTEMAGRVCQHALRSLGLAGQDATARVEQLARDARITRIYEGTSEVQRIVIARELLRGLSA